MVSKPELSSVVPSGQADPALAAATTQHNVVTLPAFEALGIESLETESSRIIAKVPTETAIAGSTTDVISQVAQSDSEVRLNHSPTATRFDLRNVAPQTNVPDREPSIITDLGHRQHALYVLKSQRQSNNSNQDNNGLSLKEQLRLATIPVPSFGGPQGSGFIPIGQLIELINESSIQQTFRRSNSGLRLSKKNAPSKKTKLPSEAVRKICGSDQSREPSTSEKDPHPINIFRKIFAILVLIDKPRYIEKFIEDGICDAHLPLGIYNTRTILSKSWLCRNDTSTAVRLRCSEKWSNNSIRQFYKSQWIVLSPFFKLEDDGKPRHLKIPNDAVLPFESIEHAGKGGFGDVYKIRIHPDHHNFSSSESETTLFADKKLRTKGEDGKNYWEQERKMLKRYSSEGHPHSHIISLLATYDQLGYYHYLFNCADTDLLNLWKTRNPTPELDQKLVVWMAKQCEGIADALYLIHLRPTTDSGKSITLPSTPSEVGSSEARAKSPISHETSPKPLNIKIYRGFHGDVKPENLVLFSSQRDSNDLGTLKLIDFGTAELKSPTDHPTLAEFMPNTPSYRAPECEVRDCPVSSSYDIWSLGCVYLNFIAWLVGGWTLLDDFARKRKSRYSDLSRFLGDEFYEVVKVNWAEYGGLGPRAFKLKDCVIKFIKELKETIVKKGYDDYSDYFNGFLHIIETQMLLVEVQSHVGDQQKRISSRHLCKRLCDLRTHYLESDRLSASTE